jgi:outer membrane protein
MSYIDRKKKKARAFVFAFAALVAAARLAAQAPPQQQSITFDDALRIALEHNGTLRLAKNANAASELGVTQQKMQFLPDLRLSTSTGQQFGRSFDQNEGQVINSSTQSMNLGVSSSVTVFDGFKNISNLHAAQLNNTASDQDVQRATQTVVFTVASDFVNLVNAQEQLRVTKESLLAQQAQEQQINKYVQAGARPISDLYQQQATVASTQSAVVNATRSVELAKVDLMQALQLNPSGT